VAEAVKLFQKVAAGDLAPLRRGFFVAGLCNDVFFGLAAARGAFGSIARHNNQLEVRIEFDLILLSVLAFHVVNFIAVVCFLNLSACAAEAFALIFSSSAGATGVSESAKVLPVIIPAAAPNAIRTNFMFIPPPASVRSATAER
jgi:hypothetical protein